MAETLTSRSVWISIRVALFYKDILDYLSIHFKGETTDDFYGAGTTGFEIFQTFKNGDGATDRKEFAFQRQIGFSSRFPLEKFLTCIPKLHLFYFQQAEGIRKWRPEKNRKPIWDY